MSIQNRHTDLISHKIWMAIGNVNYQKRQLLMSDLPETCMFELR